MMTIPWCEEEDEMIRELGCSVELDELRRAINTAFNTGRTYDAVKTRRFQLLGARGIGTMVDKKRDQEYMRALHERGDA